MSDVIIDISSQGVPGPSAYQVAVVNGYEGTEAEWLADMYAAEQNAIAQAAAAASSATESANSATASENSATSAAGSASAASTSASNAASSESAASVSASNALSSANNASASESASASSAGESASSANAALGYAASAIASKSDAENAQSAAEVAQSAAEAAQLAAETARTGAETAETNAETAEANAETAQGLAESARDSALAYRDTAGTHASTATTQAGIATTQASNAATSASEASVSASNAASSEATVTALTATVVASEDEITTVSDNIADVTTVATDLSGDDKTGTVADWLGAGGSVAVGITYDNSSSGLTATNVQAAVDEVVIEKVSKAGDTMTGDLIIRHSNGSSSGTLSLAAVSSGGGGASIVVMGNSDSAGTAGPNVIASANRTLQLGRGDSFTSSTGGTLTTDLWVNEHGIGLQGNQPSSGIGIAFPATQNASSDANTLDDYEEGTWTPTLAGSVSNPTVSYTLRDAFYTKIGNTVYIEMRLFLNSASGGSGTLFVQGLPFAAGQMDGYLNRCFPAKYDIISNTVGSGFGIKTDTSSYMKLIDTNNRYCLASDLTSSSYITIWGTYSV